MSITTPQKTRNSNPASGAWVLDGGASHARFTARTLGGLLAVPGRFGTLGGSLSIGADGGAGELTIAAAGIDTANRLRDSHLRSRGFLRASEHPEIRYEASSVEFDGDAVRLDGELQIAGTSTSLPLTAELRSHNDDVIELVARTTVDRVQLGVRGARGMVPRAVQIDVKVVLRQAA